MTLFRAVPIHVHGALELVAAPLLLVAPFALGFAVPTGIISFALGVLLIGLALSIDGDGDRGSLPLSAHVGFDYMLALVTLGVGAAVGLAGDYAASVFMVGFGSAHLALTASTRFSRPAGA